MGFQNESELSFKKKNITYGVEENIKYLPMADVLNFKGKPLKNKRLI